MPATPLALLAFLAAAPPPPVFFADGPFDPAVPRPDALLGRVPGEGRISTYRDQERVLLAIAAKAPGRVRAWTIGESAEGRPLRVYALTSEANLKRLDAIRAEHERLGRGEAVDTVPIVWINECIHGNEPASFEAAMGLIYHLAASRSARTKGLLDRAVVLVNPVYNPDGHERFAVAYNSVARGEAEDGAFEQQENGLLWGRSNHYRFDMNRDRISMTQPETRAAVAEELRWAPQVFADQHGQTENYFFPPNPMAMNANVDRARVNKWTDVFGRAAGREFDARGWTYFSKDTFDLYYPGYLDSFTSLYGAIGMTHETDGDKFLAVTRADGSVATLRSAAEKHFVTALAVAHAAADRGADLLKDFREFRRRAVSGESAGKFRRVVLSDPDPRRLERLRVQLERMGVVSGYAGRAWSQPDAHDYWSSTVGAREFPAGSLVVDLAQPLGPLAKAMLEPQSDFEPEFLKKQRELKKTAPEGEKDPGPDDAEFYDLTGWALPYAHGLRAWWCETSPALSLSPLVPRPSSPVPDSQVGYAIPYSDTDDALAVLEILQSGVRGTFTTEAVQSAGADLPKGTFLFLAARNDEGYGGTIRRIAAKRGSRVIPLQTSYGEGRFGAGSPRFETLREPKIAVVFGDRNDWGGAGSVWWLFEREFGVPFRAIPASRLNGDLSEFTAIVLPGGVRPSSTTRLREWVSGGGRLVSLGGGGLVGGSGGFVDLSRVEGEIESLPGSLFRAKIDPRSPLLAGYAPDQEIAVPLSGSTFYRTRKEGGSVVTVPEGKNLLTGWSFEGTEKAVGGAVFVQTARIGQGRATIFLEDPTDRALWPGLHRMLLNALFLG